jgi:hypothetical protein
VGALRPDYSQAPSLDRVVAQSSKFMIAFYAVRFVERLLSMKKHHHTISPADIERILDVCLNY